MTAAASWSVGFLPGDRHAGGWYVLQDGDRTIPVAAEAWPPALRGRSLRHVCGVLEIRTEDLFDGMRPDVRDATRSLLGLTLGPRGAEFAIFRLRRTRCRRLAECRGCLAPILWLDGPHGRRRPAELATARPEDWRWEDDRHIDHRDACPSPPKRRRGRRR